LLDPLEQLESIPLFNLLDYGLFFEGILVVGTIVVDFASPICSNDKELNPSSIKKTRIDDLDACYM
jgi:hypothetical protein